MPGAQPRKSQQRQIGSAVNRRTGSAGGPGGYDVNPPNSGHGASDGGDQEVFVETYDEAISFARGYVHITFDPDGTYTAP